MSPVRVIDVESVSLVLTGRRERDQTRTAAGGPEKNRRVARVALPSDLDEPNKLASEVRLIQQDQGVRAGQRCIDRLHGTARPVAAEQEAAGEHGDGGKDQ